MARSEKQKLKLYYIINIMEKQTDEDHPISVGEIIDQLADMGITAERKSIYRDFEAMENLGYEIIPVHNKRFRYYLSNRKFEIAELRLLVDAVQASRFITKRKSNELIKKLEELTTVYDAEKLQSQVFVANRIKSNNESIYYNVDRIHSAIQMNVKISFTYFNWDVKKNKVYRRGGAEYIISPWALCWMNENYYLVGYETESHKIKHFRVDRMSSIEITDEKRDGKNEFKDIDMAIYSKRFFGMYNGEITRVTLNCRKDLTNAVIDRFGSEVAFELREDGESFDVTVDVALSPVFYAWVFTFGGSIKIKSPSFAVEELTNMAKNFIKD